MNLFKQLLRFAKMTRRVGGWRMVTTLVRQLPQQVTLFTRLLGEARVPIAAKLVLVGAVVFAISPLNLPQYIPVIGELDDLGIALWAISFFQGQIPLDVMADHKKAVGLPTGLVEI
jgi:uncharacterized membrane protein YkvA (DUF1232 family)